MKPISPWFQTAALLSAIRHAICDLETARPADHPTAGRSERLTPQACRSGKDHDMS